MVTTDDGQGYKCYGIGVDGIRIQRSLPLDTIQVQHHVTLFPTGSYWERNDSLKQNKGGVERRRGEGNGTPLQCSCLENPMDGGAWWAAVYGVAKSQTRLSDFTFTFLFHALEKEMATHSSVLAWRTPGMGEPGGLPSMGSHRVRHDWSDLAAAAADFRLNQDL